MVRMGCHPARLSVHLPVIYITSRANNNKFTGDNGKSSANQQIPKDHQNLPFPIRYLDPHLAHCFFLPNPTHHRSHVFTQCHKFPIHYGLPHIHPLNCPFLWDAVHPIYIVHCWTHPIHHTKWHRNQISCFSTNDQTDRQTDRQSDQPTQKTESVHLTLSVAIPDCAMSERVTWLIILTWQWCIGDYMPCSPSMKDSFIFLAPAVTLDKMQLGPGSRSVTLCTMP